MCQQWSTSHYTLAIILTVSVMYLIEHINNIFNTLDNNTILK